MDGYLEIPYKMGQFKPYQKEILSRGLGGIFFPMSFIEGGQGDRVLYRTAGYVPLYSIGEIQEEDALIMICRLLEGMLSAEQHCIFIGEYRIGEGLLGVEHLMRTPKLLYQPWTYQTMGEITSDFLGIMMRMEQKVSGTKSYFHKGTELVQQGTLSMDVLLHRMELLRLKKIEESGGADSSGSCCV